MDVSVVIDSTPAEFLARSRQWLMREEVHHSLILGTAEGLSPDLPGPMLATAHNAAGIQAVAIRMPSRRVMLCDGPTDAIDALGVALYRHSPSLPGVIGPVAAAERFAKNFAHHSGARPSRTLRMQLHHLEQVADVARPSGELRIATPADLGPLTPWAEAFVEQSGSDQPQSGQALLLPYLTHGSLYLWEVRGQPMSMVGWSRTTAHGAAISLVFTPDFARGHGYASFLVAELSRTILSRGKRFCVLFTNLANPRVNALYARIGYNPRERYDSWSFTFEDRATKMSRIPSH